jgi:hypothetical protein
MNRLTLCARNHNHHHTDFNTWASSWSSDQGKLKYYDDSSAVAKAQLVNYNIDFGVSGDALGDGWDQLIEDAALLPLAVLPLVPGTHTPFQSARNSLARPHIYTRLIYIFLW